MSSCSSNYPVISVYLSRLWCPLRQGLSFPSAWPLSPSVELDTNRDWMEQLPTNVFQRSWGFFETFQHWKATFPFYFFTVVSCCRILSPTHIQTTSSPVQTNSRVVLTSNHVIRIQLSTWYIERKSNSPSYSHTAHKLCGNVRPVCD